MITLHNMQKPSSSSRGPRGRGRGRRQTAPPAVTREALRSWFNGALPDDWFADPIDLIVDRDEIVVTGKLPLPKLADGDDVTVAAEARISIFREETREQRIGIAQQAEQQFERAVSWQVTCGDAHRSFTRASVPVMTRLHLEDRQLLDTLIDAGVARSRSEAMAWCVRLVAENEAGWIDELREAMTDLEATRKKGPESQRST